MVRPRAKLILLICFVVVGAFLAYESLGLPNCADVRGYLETSGRWAPVVFTLASTFLGLFFFPRTLILLAAGMALGTVGGSIAGLLSGVLSAILSFILTRYVAGEWIAWALNKFPKFRRLGVNVESAGLSFVLFSRFLHLPFSMINYGLALLPVSFRDYFLGTVVGLIPGTIVIAYVGESLGCSILDGKAGVPRDTAILLGGSLTLLALLSLVPVWLSRRAARRRK